MRTFSLAFLLGRLFRVVPSRSSHTVLRLFLVLVLGVQVSSLLGANPVYANGGTTRWVSPVGSPAAPGTSCEAPGYSTIGAAITDAVAGDTIRVCAGTYAESPSLTKSLTLLGPNDAVSPNGPSDRSVLNASRLTEAIITGTMTMNTAATGSVVSGFSFTGTGRAVSAVGARVIPDSVTISKNLFRKDGEAIYWTDNGGPGVDSRGKNWTLHDNRAEATTVSSAGSVTAFYGWYLNGVTVTDNVIIGYARGMQFPSSVQGVFEVSGNLVKNTASRSLQIAYPGVNENSGTPYNAGQVDWRIEGNTFESGNLSSTAVIRFLGGPAVAPQLSISVSNNLFEDSAENPTVGSVILWEGGTNFGPKDRLTVSNNRFDLVSAKTFRYLSGPNDQVISMERNSWGAADDAIEIAGQLEVETPTGTQFSTAPWIGLYQDDPAKVGQTGFWPINISYGSSASVPAGTDVALPIVGENNLPVATITFANVTGAGVTSVLPKATSDPGFVEPSGFTLGDPPVYFDVATTAVLAGGSTIKLCFNFPANSFAVGEEPRLWHYQGGAWVDITVADGTSVVERVVCGVTSSLSPFALGVMETDDPPPPPPPGSPRPWFDLDLDQYNQRFAELPDTR